VNSVTLPFSRVHGTKNKRSWRLLFVGARQRSWLLFVGARRLSFPRAQSSMSLSLHSFPRTHYEPRETSLARLSQSSVSPTAALPSKSAWIKEKPAHGRDTTRIKMKRCPDFVAHPQTTHYSATFQSNKGFCFRVAHLEIIVESPGCGVVRQSWGS
jgi:hypothetical protein